jgi:hypothetical protein
MTCISPQILNKGPGQGTTPFRHWLLALLSEQQATDQQTTRPTMRIFD